MNEKKPILKTRSSAIMICLLFVLLFVFSLAVIVKVVVSKKPAMVVTFFPLA